MNPSKQAQELIISQNVNKASHLLLALNNPNVTQIICEKHLGMILDSSLAFIE